MYIYVTDAFCLDRTRMISFLHGDKTMVIVTMIIRPIYGYAWSIQLAQQLESGYLRQAVKAVGFHPFFATLDYSFQNIARIQITLGCIINTMVAVSGIFIFLFLEIILFRFFKFFSPDFHELWHRVMSICLFTEVKQQWAKFVLGWVTASVLYSCLWWLCGLR